jgi:hypothetical protein
MSFLGNAYSENQIFYIDRKPDKEALFKGLFYNTEVKLGQLSRRVIGDFPLYCDYWRSEVCEVYLNLHNGVEN